MPPSASGSDASSGSVRVSVSVASSAPQCAQPIRIEFARLTCALQERDWRGQVVGEQTILKGISGCFEPGQLVAIMGASGSGKTTLLNLLSNRGGVRQSSRCTGEILFNGKRDHEFTAADMHTLPPPTARFAQPQSARGPPVDEADATPAFDGRHNPVLESRMGNVLQSDFLLAHLTVRETLFYSSSLRLPRSLSDEAKAQRVADVIRELNLSHVADSRVGDERVRGLSGGEKRRVSVAIQMLIDPSVLFLVRPALRATRTHAGDDEPTTGLDAFTALNIVTTLRMLAHEQRRSIISTLHQPRESIFDLFDKVMLMVRGWVVFSGPPRELVAFLDRHGYSLPLNINPADYVMDLFTLQPPTASAVKALALARSRRTNSQALTDAEAQQQRYRAAIARVRRLKKAWEASVATAPIAGAAADAKPQPHNVARLLAPVRLPATDVPAGADVASAAEGLSTPLLSPGLSTPTRGTKLAKLAPRSPLDPKAASYGALSDDADAPSVASLAAPGALPSAVSLHSRRASSTSDMSAGGEVFGASFLGASWLLVRRSLVSLLRDRAYLLAIGFETIFVSLMLGGIFYAVGDSDGADEAGLRSRVAGLYMLTSLHFYLVSSNSGRADASAHGVGHGWHR